MPGAVCSLMRLDESSGALSCFSAPSASRDLTEALDGLVPSELAGSCGTAAYTGRIAIVEDTRDDPRWRDLQAVVQRFGIRSCWSIPFFSQKDEVLGTFAISRREPGSPSDDQLELLRAAGYLAGIAISRYDAEAALRNQKDLLDSIIESIEDPIFAKDEKGRYLLVNSAEARGVAPTRRQMEGQDDAAFYPPEIAAHNLSTDTEVIETGVSVHYEQEYDNATEGKRTFLIRKAPLIGSDGRPKGVIGVARDISALKRTEEVLREAQKLESVGLLAGGIAHDFNNLLTGVLGNAQLLLERSREGGVEHASALEIKKAAVRASELTHQMLAYSGRGERLRKVIHVPTVTQEVAELLSSSISTKARLDFEVAGEPCNVEADPTQIRQLVMNILTNASEALQGRPGRIGVRISSVGREELDEGTHRHPSRAGRERYVLLEVEDTGVGMDPATQERIFDPFYTTKFDGRGLGLAAVQGIVRSHGGLIEVRSRPGAGSTFRVALPASDRAPDPGTPETVRSRWRGRGTVLVADDEPAVRNLAQAVLGEAGLEVRTAADGLEAVRIFQREADRISAVILDLTTPHLDGHEACRQLRAIRPDVPVILSSGYTERDATREFESSELSGFLQKPYLPAELVEVVRRVL